jgi:hypothetical protein
VNPSQLGRNETDLNTTKPRFSDITFFGPGNVLDRIIDGRVSTDRGCSCGDNFAVTNCIKNATFNERSGQDALVAEGNHSLLASEFEIAREFESERIGLSVKIVCNLSSEIIVGSGAID